jgi:hypothetical protein
MNTRHQLEDYLDQARKRLKWIMASQGAAVLVGALLLLTLLAAVALGRFAFSDTAVLVARLLLAAAFIGTGAWFWMRLRTLRRDGGATQLERALPAQGGRVTTYLQESAKDEGRASVLLDLLAEDARRVAEQEALAKSIPSRRLWVPGLVAGACAAALVASFLGKGLLGEATKRVWLGKETEATVIAKAAGGIKVMPGDATVRRNQDLGVTALVANGSSDVTVYVKFGDDSEWESAPMTPDGKGGYAFTLFAVRDDAQYYVSSGSLRSKEHRIQVVDLPRVQNLRLTYDYPEWTGLPSRLEESGGDIRAVSGTRVALEVVTDKPLNGPLLVIDGSDSSLSQTGSTSRGSIAVKKVGHYRIATRFGDEIVPLTPDYAIDLVNDERPTIQIGKPGKDYQATNIEEVPVNLRAKDDFRVDALELHYSVNGGDWQHDKLPAGSADIQAAALLRLEELQQRGPGGEAPLLVPGDLVSYYAMAKDHGGSTQTDLFLIQIAPFERRFTQSQANGGGGGGGEEQEGQISQRQKEVLLATFNLAKNKEGTGAREAERDADNARMLAQVQETLAEQANTLVERAKARQLERQDATVATFVKSLQDAAREMVPAAKKLTDQDLQAAIQHEQKALQHLLRAESTFRDIQVALQQQQGGGGGGGGGQAGRDVAEMTELELDLEKNQYETEPQMSSQQQAQAEDEIARRLKELAKRQEQLAREAERKNIPVEQQKWQQEQLQREAEQLRQQLEQLAQQQSQQGQQGQQSQSQQGQQGQQSQQGQQQSRQQQQARQQGQQGQQGQSGQQQGQQSAASQAAQQVAQAMEQMRQAQQRGDREAAARASEQLNRAREQLENSRQQGNSAQQLANLAQEASELADQQREAAQDLRAAVGDRRPGSGLSATEAERLAEQMRQVQRELGQLQGELEDARRQSRQESPRASQKLAQAAQELQESGAPSSLARVPSDIRNGRTAEALTRNDLIIGGALERLEQQLAEARDLAGGEARNRQQARQANEGDLLNELADARRALERARRDAATRTAQNQQGSQPGERGERNGSQQGGQSPNAQEGQSGQGGGQQGQDGEGGQGERGQNGGSQQAGAAGQRGANGANGGGVGRTARFGSGDDGMGGVGRVGDVTPLTEAERAALRQQGQLSGQRLQALRDQLGQGALNEVDAAALMELSERLRRTGADPRAMADAERMLALVNQLELAVLQSQTAKSDKRTTRSADPVDDSRRYRDNVAEYYRKLGEANDGK